MPARNYVPVAAGDEVATQNGAAVIQFRDGSNVTLPPNSKVRIEGQPSKPVVHVMKGSVSYNLAPSSRIRVLNTRDELVSAPAISSSVNPANPQYAPLAAGVVYGSRQTGLAVAVAPDAPTVTGSFVSGGNQPAGGTGRAFSGTLDAGTQPGTAQIITPGFTFNLTVTMTTNPTTGVVTDTYTVASVQATVATTSAGLSGPTATVTVGASSGSSLIGASVALTTIPSTGDVTFTITPTNGTTVTASTITTAVQQQVNTEVQAHTLPNTTPAVPQQSPVTTGQFSSSAP